MMATYPGNKAKTVTWLTVISLLFIVVAGIFINSESFSEDDIDPKLHEPLLVNTAKLHLEDGYKVMRRFIGQVEPAQTTELGFELSGRVVEINIDEGDRFKQGQIIARLDIQRLKAQKNEILAQLKEVRTQINLARKTRNRMRKALEYGGVTSQRFDEAEQGLQSSQARRNTLQASIDRIDIEIKKSNLYAPYDGYVLQRNVDTGSVVSPGISIVRIQQISKSQARVGIANEVINELSVNQSISTKVEGRSNSAKIIQIDGERDMRTRTIDIILQLETDKALSGDLVELEIEHIIEEKGHWVPMSALAEGERGLWTIFITNQEESQDNLVKLDRVFVEILHHDTEQVYIRMLPETVTEYVVDGLQRVVPGQTVRRFELSSKSIVRL